MSDKEKHAFRVLACGCVLGRERCFDCRPGLHADQEEAIAITLRHATYPLPTPHGRGR